MRATFTEFDDLRSMAQLEIVADWSAKTQEYTKFWKIRVTLTDEKKFVMDVIYIDRAFMLIPFEERYTYDSAAYAASAFEIILINKTCLRLPTADQVIERAVRKFRLWFIEH